MTSTHFALSHPVVIGDAPHLALCGAGVVPGQQPSQPQVGSWARGPERGHHAGGDGHDGVGGGVGLGPVEDRE